MNKNILIIGGTSGIMIPYIEKLSKKRNQIFASYNNDESYKNLPAQIKERKNIIFFKLNLLDNNEKIIKTLEELKVDINIIINAVGGVFWCKGVPL